VEPYVHEDVEGDRLIIAEREGKPGVALVKARGGAEVTALDLPVIVAKLYEACGLNLPVILDRPEVPVPGSIARCGMVTIDRLRDQVTLGLYGVQPEGITPAEARVIAGYLVAYADHAETEPDPAEVEALAAVVREAGFFPGLPVASLCELAGAILRAGYERKAES
jgi:hypothetical protein